MAETLGLQAALNIIAGTTGLSPQGAANVGAQALISVGGIPGLITGRSNWIFYDSSINSYPVRPTALALTSPGLWIGPTAPSTDAGYMVAGIDFWFNTTIEVD